MHGNGAQDGRACGLAQSETCPCTYGVCPAGYKMNKGVVPQGWNEWGSRRRYPYPKGHYFPHSCPCILTEGECPENTHVFKGRCKPCGTLKDGTKLYSERTKIPWWLDKGRSVSVVADFVGKCYTRTEMDKRMPVFLGSKGSSSYFAVGDVDNGAVDIFGMEALGYEHKSFRCVPPCDNVHADKCVCGGNSWGLFKDCEKEKRGSCSEPLRKNGIFQKDTWAAKPENNPLYS